MSPPDLKIWLVIFGLAGATFLIRYSFLGLLAGRTLPPWFVQALGFVPVTVLPALVAPMLVYGEAGGLAEPHRWISGLITVAVGIWTRNLFAGFSAGVAAFILLRLAGV